MKNYKHSVKSGNAMKLAAVASAAIMMAPVALNSVSTFADTPAAATPADATIDDLNTAIDAYSTAIDADKALVSSNAFKKLTSAQQKTATDALAKAEASLATYKGYAATENPSTADLNKWTKGVEAKTSIAKSAQTIVGAQIKKAMTAATQDAMSQAAKTTAAQEAAAVAADAAKQQATQAALTSAQKAVDAASALYDALPSAQKNSTKGNILLGAINSVKAAIKDGKNSAALTNAATTLSDASKNIFTTSTGNANSNGTIADTPNKSTEASDKAEAAAKAAEAAKQAVIDALNQQIKGLEAEKATTTNKSTLASLNAQIVALNTRINELKGNTIASTPNMSTEASKKAEAAAKQNNRFTGIAHINYAKGYGIQVWTKDHKIVKNADGSAKKLGGETNWKVFGGSVNIDGKNMYCVGGNQYVDAAYVTLTHSVSLDK